MSVEIQKICRTCLALNGPLLSIYDGGTYGDTIADMLRDFTKMKPIPTDNMPQKVCLTCISEINRCYSFKMKCENSNRTLRQLLPDATPEEHDSPVNKNKEQNILLTTRSVQTTPEREISKRAVQVQTSPIVDHCPEPIPSEVSIQEAQEDISTTALYESLAESANLTSHTGAKARKRRAVTSHNSGSTKQIYKKKITESYNIGCEVDGYEFILKLDNNRQTDEVSEKEINDESVIGNSMNCTIDNANSYEITDGNFDCEEYEIEAVVEVEDQAVSSEEVVYVKTESTGIGNNSQKDFVVVKSVEKVSPIKKKEIKTANIRREYGCVECVMSFYSLKVLRRHMIKLHGQNNDEIDLNDMKYRLLDKNKSSTSSETPENNTDIPIIGEEDLKHYASHSVTEPVKNTILKYICSKCKSSFSSQRSLNYHKKKNICNAKSYECDQCERVFTSSDNLKSHKTSHNDAAIECQECSKTFMTTEELSNHQISVHKRSVRNQCNICKKVFTMLSTLRDHLRTHSGEKPFLCTICGKAFTQSANLKQHIQRHDKDKKFKCDECANSYVTKAELFSHKRSHNGDHPYKCEHCSATFTTSSSLVKHRRRHTGERPYACDICPMRFAVLNVLKNHRRLHTGEKPYKCPHCDKRFTQRGDCMIHASKHVENNVFICTCGKSFAHAALLRQHSKRSHPEIYNEQHVRAKLSEDESVVFNYATDGEVEGESQIQQEEDEDLIELNLAKICGQSTSQ